MHGGIQEACHTDCGPLCHIVYVDMDFVIDKL